MISIDVKGTDSTYTDFKKLSVTALGRAKARMEQLCQRAADVTRERMRSWIWRTGNLAGSLDSDAGWQGDELLGIVYTPVKYGIYVHFGTSKMKARPFMDYTAQYLRENATRAFMEIV